MSCKGSSDFLNLWLAWHLLAKGILLKLDASHDALVVLLVLEATQVLLINVFLQHVLVIRSILAQILSPKVAAQEFQSLHIVQRKNAKVPSCKPRVSQKQAR